MKFETLKNNLKSVWVKYPVVATALMIVGALVQKMFSLL